MRYESEILYDLMKRDGLLNPPQNKLPYESELKEKYVEDVVGAYPKLNDYRSEWLNYALEDGNIGEFPYVTLTNVTNATINNVVPYAYKSAILKGNSEVGGKNKCNMEEIQTGWIDGSSGEVTSNTGVYIPVKVSGTITISNFIHDKSRYVYEYDGSGNYLGRKSVTTNNVTLSLNENTTLIKIGFYNATLSDVKSLKLQVEQGEIATEYEPYNPSLVSVKMPVLTTIGKNLFNKEGLVLQNKKRVRADNGEFVYSTASSGFDNYFDCQFLQGKTINVSSIATGSGGEIAFYTIDKTYIKGGKLPNSQLVPENAFYYRFSINVIDTSIDEAKIQIEVNSVATLYEPYKSNILTVNEDVTLRSNGDVYDELNLLTGLLTQRIDENNEVLAQEVVKTVDLKVINQDGENVSLKPIEGTMHLTTSSDTIPPLFSGEIPVEAIEQNLASFADLEGVEHDG